MMLYYLPLSVAVSMPIYLCTLAHLCFDMQAASYTCLVRFHLFGKISWHPGSTAMVYNNTARLWLRANLTTTASNYYYYFTFITFWGNVAYCLPMLTLIPPPPPPTTARVISS